MLGRQLLRAEIFFCLRRNLNIAVSPNLHFHDGFEPENINKFSASFLLFENIVSENEEENFMNEMEPHLKRHVYEKDHWDDVSSSNFQLLLVTRSFRQFKALGKLKENFSIKRIQPS